MKYGKPLTKSTGVCVLCAHLTFEEVRQLSSAWTARLPAPGTNAGPRNSQLVTRGTEESMIHAHRHKRFDGMPSSYLPTSDSHSSPTVFLMGWQRVKILSTKCLYNYELDLRNTENLIQEFFCLVQAFAHYIIKCIF